MNRVLRSFSTVYQLVCSVFPGSFVRKRLPRNRSAMCEGERTYFSSGEVSEGTPSDYDPLKLHVTADRVHGPDAAPARGEAERHPEPFPQVRFGVRTRPAAPLGRRKVSAAGGLGTRGRNFPDKKVEFDKRRTL